MRQIPTEDIYCGECCCKEFGPNLNILSDGTITGKHCQKWDTDKGVFHKMFGWKRLPRCKEKKPQVLTEEERGDIFHAGMKAGYDNAIELASEGGPR